MAKVNSQTDIAVLKTDVAYIKDSVMKIDGTLALMEKDFVRRSEFDTYKDQQTQTMQDFKLVSASQSSSISTLDISIATLKTQIRTWAILGGILLAIVQSVVTAVIIQMVLHFA